MRYYVKIMLDGIIDQRVDTFSTLEEANNFKRFAEYEGYTATVYEMELREVK